MLFCDPIESFFHENSPLSRRTSSLELALQPVFQEKSRIGGISDTESSDDFLIQSASGEVFAGAGALGPPQALLKECTGTLVNFEQHGAQLGFLSFRRTAEANLRQSDPQLLRHRPYRFRESYIFDLLDKAEDIP